MRISADADPDVELRYTSTNHHLVCCARHWQGCANKENFLYSESKQDKLTLFHYSYLQINICELLHIRDRFDLFSFSYDCHTTPRFVCHVRLYKTGAQHDFVSPATFVAGEMSLVLLSFLFSYVGSHEIKPLHSHCG